jgi:hypothetical protein
VLTDFPEEAHEDSLRKLHVFGDMQTLHRFVDVVEGLMDLPQATPSHHAFFCKIGPQASRSAFSP